MEEIEQVGSNTYCLGGYTNVGIVKLDTNQVCLIDTGIDSNVAAKIEILLNRNKWRPVFILNTHYHADHVGGNHYLQAKYNIPAYAVTSECMLSNNTDIAVSLLYGANSPKPMREKLLQAQCSNVCDISVLKLPNGFEYKHIDGHSFNMLAYKTPDNIWFVADTVLSSRILKRNHLTYNYDIGQYLQSLQIVKSLSGDLFIPSHAEPCVNLQPLLEANRDNIIEIIDNIKDICVEPQNIEEIFKILYDKWNLKMSLQVYSVIGSALRSMLTYMYEEKILEMNIVNNRLLWSVK